MMTSDLYHRQFTACMYEDYENESINANQHVPVINTCDLKVALAPMLIKVNVPTPMVATSALPASQQQFRELIAPPNGGRFRRQPCAVHQPQNGGGRNRSIHNVSSVNSSIDGTPESTPFGGPQTVTGGTNSGVLGGKSFGHSGISFKKHKMSKSSYKHVPHREKPPHLVERRNARERRRVQAVNSAFARLRKCVPLENRNKRLSKVKTLQKAIDYIYQLQQVLEDEEQEEKALYERLQAAGTVNKESAGNGGHESSPRWMNSCVDTTNQRHSPYISMYDGYPTYSS